MPYNLNDLVRSNQEIRNELKQLTDVISQLVKANANALMNSRDSGSDTSSVTFEGKFE